MTDEASQFDNDNCIEKFAREIRYKLIKFRTDTHHHHVNRRWQTRTELRNSDSFDGFKRFLKTILFSRYYKVHWRFSNEKHCIKILFSYLLANKTACSRRWFKIIMIATSMMTITSKVMAMKPYSTIFFYVTHDHVQSFSHSASESIDQSRWLSASSLPTRFPLREDTLCFIIALANINRFLKFFHQKIPEEMCYVNCRLMRCYTTLWQLFKMINVCRVHTIICCKLF